MTIGSASALMSQNEQVKLLRRAIDEGVDHFDTADAYGSGMSERLLGKALQGRRNQVTISTKGGYLFRERRVIEQRGRRIIARAIRRSSASPAKQGSVSSTPSSYSSQDFSPDHLRSAVEGSLRRLQVDHIDVFLLHGPHHPDEKTFEQLANLRASGKVGRFGVGAETVPSAAAWVQNTTAEVVQLPFGPLDAAARSDVLPLASSENIEFWARGVLGGGVLASAMRSSSTIEAHSKRAQIEELLAIAHDAGMGLDELALRWVRGCRGIDMVLLGMSSVAHLDRNLRLARQPALPDDIRSQVESSIEESRIDHRSEP